MPIAASGLDLPMDSVLKAIVPLQILWVLYFGVKGFFIACPRCGRSVFTSEWGAVLVSRPWPRKLCSKCGADLTVAD
jgi:ribosomal protein S27AE